MNQAKQYWQQNWHIVFGLLVILVTILFAPLFMNYQLTQGERYDAMKYRPQQIPYNQTAIVFGAGILENGTPTPYLANRLSTAIALYKAKRVDKILVTGDSTSRGHNEPVIMKNYLASRGVNSSDIQVDEQGYNTHASCVRAKQVFHIDHATLISQGYHLPRAMTTCSLEGINNVGVAAIRKGRDVAVTYLIREFISTDKMLLQAL